MIAVRIYYKKRLFEFFSGQNTFNSCVKNECVLSLSNNVLPYNRVRDEEEFVSNLQSILLKVRRRMYLSSLSIG